MARINQRLNGLNPLAYLGDNSYQPPEFVTYPRAPTTTDSQNFELGTIWLDMSGYPVSLPTNEDIWMLVALVGGTATWVNFGGGDLETLTGNSGGPVSPDINDNINVIGDGIGITIVGTPLNNTLTASLVGGGIAAQSFPTGVGVSTTSGGTALPTAAGVLNVLGSHNVLTGAAVANTITVFGTNTITVGDLAVRTTGQDSITVTSGNITLSGTGASAAGNINFPATTTDGRQGIVNWAGTRFISNYLNTTAVGNGSGNLTATGLFGSAFGISSLSSLTSGSANSGFGAGALQFITTGDNNTAVGFLALQDETTGSQNTALGAGALANTTTSSRNTAVGYFALTSFLTGSNNTALGDSAGSQYTGAESNNILIGASVLGTVGESNVTRIGNGTGTGTGQQNKCFISGIRGITTDVNDAVPVLIDSAGQLGVTSSSERYKENIKTMGKVSDDIHMLRPVTFNYKSDKQHKTAYGLIAEEVELVMPNLVIYNDGIAETVRYHDLVPLLLNEVQKLKKLVDELHKR